MNTKIGLFLALLFSGVDAVVTFSGRTLSGQEYQVSFEKDQWDRLAASPNSRGLREAIASDLARQGLEENLLAIKHKIENGAEDQFPVDVPDGSVVEGNIIRSTNFLYSSMDNEIWLDIGDKIRCFIKLSPFDNAHVPREFSTQYLGKLLDSEATMYMSGVDFVDKETHRKTSFSSSSFKVRLTGDLVEFLGAHTSHFAQLHGTYQGPGLFFWLARKGFAIYDRSVVVSDFEDRLRRAIGWETLREQINAMRLPGEPEVL